MKLELYDGGGTHIPPLICVYGGEFYGEMVDEAVLEFFPFCNDWQSRLAGVRQQLDLLISKCPCA